MTCKYVIHINISLKRKPDSQTEPSVPIHNLQKCFSNSQSNWLYIFIHTIVSTLKLLQTHCTARKVVDSYDFIYLAQFVGLHSFHDSLSCYKWMRVLFKCKGFARFYIFRYLTESWTVVILILLVVFSFNVVALCVYFGFLKCFGFWMISRSLFWLS